MNDNVIYLLIISIILLFFASNKANQAIENNREAKEARRDAYRKELNANQALRDASQKEQNANTLKKNIIEIINEKQQSYPWLAKVFSDYLYVLDASRADYLSEKKHPAFTAAQHVSEIAKEKREVQKAYKLLEYQLNYYENVIPWLEEFKVIDPIEAYVISKEQNRSEDNEYQQLNKWLSPEEYKKLPNVEKYQIALDRYCKRKKTSWEIGIEFERFIGYSYEQKGYDINYNGALTGLNDMGRDIIAHNSKETLVIQCKRWHHNKTIHEKHIFQLYGSVVLMKTENEDDNIRGIFVTTTKLSETASRCAEYLHIDVLEGQSFETYPMIKCNIASNGEKIYHLPMDQQYDRVKLHKKGELYAETVLEAENAGFRRALHWSGNK